MKPLWLLLCAPLLAHAVDSPCGGPASNTYVDFTVAPASTCAPWPKGEGTVPTLRYNSAGATVWWYCPRPDGSWGYTLRAASTSLLTPAYLNALTLDLAQATRAVSPTLDLNTLTMARINRPLADPTLAPVWCPWWSQVAAGIPPSANNLVPPAASVMDAQGAIWTIMGGWAVRNGVQTNGHALQILFKGGAIYAQSPTGLIWWKYAGPPDKWLKLTTTMP